MPRSHLTIRLSKMSLTVQTQDKFLQLQKYRVTFPQHPTPAPQHHQQIHHLRSSLPPPPPQAIPSNTIVGSPTPGSDRILNIMEFIDIMVRFLNIVRGQTSGRERSNKSKGKADSGTVVRKPRTKARLERGLERTFWRVLRRIRGRSRRVGKGNSDEKKKRSRKTPRKRPRKRRRERLTKRTQKITGKCHRGSQRRTSRGRKKPAASVRSSVISVTRWIEVSSAYNAVSLMI